MEELFIVQYEDYRDCFVRVFLSNRSTRKINFINGSCIKVRSITAGFKELYLSYKFMPNPIQIGNSFNILSIDPVFAKKINLMENVKYLISLAEAAALQKVYVKVTTNDDLQMLLNCKQIVENKLLAQVRIVSKSQIIPVWSSRNITLDLVIDKLLPDINYGYLEENCELILVDSNTSDNSRNIVPSLDNNTVTTKVKGRVGVTLLEKGNVLTVIRPHNYYHVVPAKALGTKIDVLEKNSQTYVYVSHHPEHERDKYDINGPASYKIICELTKIDEKTNAKAKILNSNETKDKKTKFYIMYAITAYSLVTDNVRRIYCTPQLMKQLNLKVGMLVEVEPVYHIHSKIPKESMLPFVENQKEKEIVCREALWSDLKEVKNRILHIVKNNGLQGMNILLSGSCGTGKSYFLGALEKILAVENIYATRLNCKPLRSKKAESLSQYFIEGLSKCAYRAPSVFLIDDLDALTSVTNQNNHEVTYNTNYINRVGMLIKDIVTLFQLRSQVTVVATVQSTSQLGSELRSTRGTRLFESIFEIKELTSDDRLSITRNLLNTNNIKMKNHDLQKMDDRTKGFTVQDLNDLVSKMILQCSVHNREVIDEEIFDTAFSDTIPSSLQGIDLHKNNLYVWDDVGGLSQVKKTLVEILVWPSRYPEIFNSFPLRHQTGILLYGAPGTGKTLIAGAAAHECHLNFISIKGPELLSKYVGASEEAVRNLFARAQKAKPCLLFFDEFDSLAPRRGHDSTGVTDRVVNQLLTQLDGVEALTGVWVIAATSRPDLLDPALLRPGRLDRAILCEVPNQDERVSIMTALGRKLRISEYVDLSEVADKADGYTGADLHAVLYNAQMLALKQAANFPNPELKKLTIEVTEAHLEEALESTKPSLTEIDRRRYQKIYDRFVSSGGGDFAADQSEQKQRVTLA